MDERINQNMQRTRTITMPEDYHKAAKVVAALNGVSSLSELFRVLLRAEMKFKQQQYAPAFRELRLTSLLIELGWNEKK